VQASWSPEILAQTVTRKPIINGEYLKVMHIDCLDLIAPGSSVTSADTFLSIPVPCCRPSKLPGHNRKWKHRKSRQSLKYIQRKCLSLPIGNTIVTLAAGGLDRQNDLMRRLLSRHILVSFLSSQRLDWIFLLCTTVFWPAFSLNDPRKVSILRSFPHSVALSQPTQDR
jgi:hypothetical protein